MNTVQPAVSYWGQSSDYVTAPCDGTNLGIVPHVQPNPQPLLNCTHTYQPIYQNHAFPPFYRDKERGPAISLQLIYADEKNRQIGHPRSLAALCVISSGQ